jgi:hypothetical protein
MTTAARRAVLSWQVTSNPPAHCHLGTGSLHPLIISERMFYILSRFDHSAYDQGGFVDLPYALETVVL